MYTGAEAANSVSFTNAEGGQADGVLAAYEAGDQETPGSQEGTFTLSVISEPTEFYSTCTFTLASGNTLEARTKLIARR